MSTYKLYAPVLSYMPVRRAHQKEAVIKNARITFSRRRIKKAVRQVVSIH